MLSTAGRSDGGICGRPRVAGGLQLDPKSGPSPEATAHAAGGVSFCLFISAVWQGGDSWLLVPQRGAETENSAAGQERV